MSIYAYLNCHDCRQTIWLGKALHTDYKPYCFHIGQPEEPPHWQREQLNQVIWKFLADHANHHIDVRLEQDVTEAMGDYQEIGGDRDGDISVEEYLREWKGLNVGHPSSVPPPGNQRGEKTC